MSGNATVLYDLANNANLTFSPNPWKSRLALNFKGVPFETEWVEYADLEPKFKALGIPPNPEGPYKFTDYTSPAVRFADGTYVMDSQAIAEKLEALYPEPSFHLDTGLHDEAAAIMQELMWSLFPDLLHLLPKGILSERSAVWFAEDRKRRFGISLDDLAAAKGGEVAWEAAQPHMAALKTFLTSKKKDEGPFIMGSTPSYGDLIIIALFQSLDVVKKESLARLVGYCSEFEKLREAGKQWAR
ncbi:hypothetical protein D0869_11220 [Hortaea werneckii]|uniref:GST N-terminal domain-containing protein n=1 Tax=Hortaea werneckii TaxID=91943 RepID=A0A3M6Y0Y2_HORWE|nr:hypothetical protein KC334_g1089 [Hortaea werneckii]KAI7021127.1 hypothetical protein KC355_g2492 [Hortaea werneckii]KAI7191008.1 hypothetical protein KC324_g5851 [Hortaea werneckii]KAI7584808.1 hypothetical protein KC316_g6489 [Hortaea werneckii]KAI7675332.1 hypothetical protein KC318_g1022 [Hortaea werneckii]